MMITYSYTPSGDQPMGEQEMKIRGVHCLCLMALRVCVVFASIVRADLSHYYWRHGCVDYVGMNMLDVINYVFIVLNCLKEEK